MEGRWIVCRGERGENAVGGGRREGSSFKGGQRPPGRVPSSEKGSQEVRDAKEAEEEEDAKLEEAVNFNSNCAMRYSKPARLSSKVDFYRFFLQYRIEVDFSCQIFDFRFLVFSPRKCLL